MAHSHMPINHLLKQVEIYRAKREQRDARPAWLTEFVDRVAELFEPLDDVGRVGFDCHLAEDRWTLSMYLGVTEIVGGRDDGQTRISRFEFDLLRLLDHFESVERFQFSSLPDQSESSQITIEGTVAEQPIRLQIQSTPPSDAGPGFREYPDGRCEPV